MGNMKYQVINSSQQFAYNMLKVRPYCYISLYDLYLHTPVRSQDGHCGTLDWTAYFKYSLTRIFTLHFSYYVYKIQIYLVC